MKFMTLILFTIISLLTQTANAQSTELDKLPRWESHDTWREQITRLLDGNYNIYWYTIYDNDGEHVTMKLENKEGKLLQLDLDQGTDGIGKDMLETLELQGPETAILTFYKKHIDPNANITQITTTGNLEKVKKGSYRYSLKKEYSNAWLLVAEYVGSDK